MDSIFGKKLFLEYIEIQYASCYAEFVRASFSHWLEIESGSDLMEFFKLFFEQDHHKIIKLCQLFELLLKNIVIICKFSLLIIRTSFHEKGFEGLFIAIEWLNLFFVDGHCSSQIVHLSVKSSCLFDRHDNGVNFLQLELDNVIN